MDYGYDPELDRVIIIGNGTNVSLSYWELDKIYWEARTEHMERNKDVCGCR